MLLRKASKRFVLDGHVVYIFFVLVIPLRSVQTCYKCGAYSMCVFLLLLLLLLLVS